MESAEKYLKGLNDEQRQAVQLTEGVVRVIAGAGTGKTRALTSRYCYLIDTIGISPRNILCATFTNRAANEMKRRVREMLADMDLSYICTFHAFCVQFLKEEAHLFGFPKNFIIIDNDDDATQILLKVFEDMKLTLRNTTIQKTKDMIEMKKSLAINYVDNFYLLNNEQLRANFSASGDRDEEIFLRYLYEQKKCFGFDFNDLINFTLYLLQHDKKVLERWQNRMQYVLVDEFQDVSKRQYDIARLLSGRSGNLFIVGDPDQTIYTWRGSHFHLFLDFDKVYPEAKTVELGLNYRSTPEILKASNELIAHNPIRYPKQLHTENPSGPKPLYFHAKSEKEESDWIAGEIRRLQEAGAKLGEVAVLYRSHFLSRSLEECFIKKEIPYRIYSGIEFYNRKEIKDILAYLRMLTVADDLSFLRTVNLPSRKFGKKRIAALRDYANVHDVSLYEALKQNLDGELVRGTQVVAYVNAIEEVRADSIKLTMGDMMQELLDKSGYESFLRLQSDQERLDDVAELKRSVVAAGEEEEASLEDFLARAALFANIDKESREENVKLMTIHTSKGMEFPYVFICGLDEGVFPSKKTDTPEDMDEERRLAYVAMTRAVKRLYLSDSEGLSNDNIFKMPSRFIFDAGRENLEYVAELDKELVEKTRRAIDLDEENLSKRRAAFDVGDRVSHPVFGAGTILSVNAHEASYTIQFDSLKTERNLQFSAPLTPIA